MVSILVPAYNAGPWIRQCLDSALAQTYSATEVIVVDDGSTDGTAEAVRSYGNRVRFIESPHEGGNAARNKLLELARGEWLQYLDADDYLLPHKVADQMKRVEQNLDLDIVYSPVILRDEGNGSERLLAMSATADLPLHYIRWSALNTNGFLWRRSSVSEVGGWKLDQAACQEHELLFRMMEAGKRFSLVNQPGAVYR
ncbi:MAG: glycosyl transferase, family 2, partial [Bryobacterales bacterium]|nr:glycosyl transferase, family 2 [Bryobacterales bacterium]